MEVQDREMQDLLTVMAARLGWRRYGTLDACLAAVAGAERCTGMEALSTSIAQLTIAGEQDGEEDSPVRVPASAKGRRRRRLIIPDSDDSDSDNDNANDTRATPPPAYPQHQHTVVDEEHYDSAEDAADNSLDDFIVSDSEELGGISADSEGEEEEEEEEDAYGPIRRNKATSPYRRQRHPRGKAVPKAPAEASGKTAARAARAPPCMDDSDDSDQHDGADGALIDLTATTPPMTPLSDLSNLHAGVFDFDPQETATTPSCVPRQTAPPTPTASDRRGFAKKRSKLAMGLFRQFNTVIFDGRLPAKMHIEWSKKLSSTAGRTILTRKAGVYKARIELATKVVDCEARLRNTLCHEMCHAAAWLLDHNAKPPHGPCFKKHARQAMSKFPDLDIKTCHSYDINYKCTYQCTGCGQTYGRHSKSIDVDLQRCGRCTGKLQLLPRLRQDGTPMKQRKETAYDLYRKAHLGRVRREHPGLNLGEATKVLAAEYRQTQRQGGQAGRGGQGGSRPPRLNLD